MQYNPPNENLDSYYRTVSTVTGDNGWSYLLVVALGRSCFGHTIGVLACFFVDCGYNNMLSHNYATQINVLSI